MTPEAAIARLTDQRDRLIDACIIEYQNACVWRIGRYSGHEPTLELARVAVQRAAGIEKAIT